MLIVIPRTWNVVVHKYLCPYAAFDSPTCAVQYDTLVNPSSFLSSTLEPILESTLESTL